MVEPYTDEELARVRERAFNHQGPLALLNAIARLLATIDARAQEVAERDARIAEMERNWHEATTELARVYRDKGARVAELERHVAILLAAPDQALLNAISDDGTEKTLDPPPLGARR